MRWYVHEELKLKFMVYFPSKENVLWNWNLRNLLFACAKLQSPTLKLHYSENWHITWILMKP